MTLEGTMLYWLKRAATELRTDRERRMVHVAASMDADQSTIWRFEHEDSWPQRPDLLVAAYADDLGISPMAIWARALALWEASGAVSDIHDLMQYEKERAANRMTAATGKARRASRRRRAGSDESPEATGNQSQ